ncbi:MAG: hypothetical protein GY703_22030, partial [Gammaproteobacteria bacterium]|nr:hypothetical protein [Gammaproteobacteria bacterium]
TPALMGRSDTEEYPQFVSTAENVYVEKHGGVVRRGGLQFVGETRSSKVRRVPFIFSRTDSYVREFGDRYARLYQGAAAVDNVGAVQTYLGDSATTKFQYPHGLEQNAFLGDGVETTFVYTFDVDTGEEFAVWLWAAGVWTEQVENTHYTHTPSTKTVVMVTPPAVDNALIIASASITETDIGVVVTVNGEIPVNEDDDVIYLEYGTDYTVEPINTLSNILKPFSTTDWNGDATSIGTSWTLPNNGTAVSPAGSEPVLREEEIHLAHGSIVDWQVRITNVTFTRGGVTESNTSNIPLIDDGDFISIEQVDIVEG